MSLPQVCIFNSTTKLIDVVPAVSTPTGLSADAGSPIVLNTDGLLDGSFTAIRSAVTSSTYSVLFSDRHIGVTYTSTGAVTVTLYDATLVTPGTEIIIKDEAGNAATHNITIATTSSQTIDGASPSS